MGISRNVPVDEYPQRVIIMRDDGEQTNRDIRTLSTDILQNAVSPHKCRPFIPFDHVRK
jgi:hypothetical protein